MMITLLLYSGEGEGGGSMRLKARPSSEISVVRFLSLFSCEKLGQISETLLLKQ